MMHLVIRHQSKKQHMLKLWNESSVVAQAIKCTAQWEAHKGSISALQWMQQGAVPGKGFIASASCDKGFALWTPAGGRVGDYGQQLPWDWEDSKTWKNSSSAGMVSQPIHAEKPTPVSQQQSVQPVQTHDAVLDLLLREESDASLDECVYSSGDEMLPDCFTEHD